MAMVDRRYLARRLLWLVMGISLYPVGASTGKDASGMPFRLSVYAGSRGLGVPELAKRRLEQIEKYLIDESAKAPGAILLKKDVVGLEGEVMLCVELARSEANSQTLERVKSMASSVDLLSLSFTPTCRAR